MADNSEEVESTSNKSHNSEVVPTTNVKTPVCKHFGFPGNGEGVPSTKGKVVCRRCRKEMPYKNSTTNLYVHLERHHKEDCAPCHIISEQHDT